MDVSGCGNGVRMCYIDVHYYIVTICDNEYSINFVV